MMNRRHVKTLRALFAKPTSRNVLCRDLESLIVAVDGEVREREGSRISLRLNGRILNMHRPHPGKELKPYQVEDAREWLRLLGITP